MPVCVHKAIINLAKFVKYDWIFHFYLRLLLYISTKSTLKSNKLKLLDNFLRFSINNVYNDGPYKIFVLLLIYILILTFNILLFIITYLTLKIPNIIPILYTAYIDFNIMESDLDFNIMESDPDLKAYIDYIKSTNKLITYKGIPEGTPNGMPGGTPGGSNESGLFLSNNDQENNKYLKTRQRSYSAPLPSNIDRSNLNPISKDDNSLPETQVNKNISLKPSFNLSIPSIPKILSWLSDSTSLSSVDSQGLENSSVSPSNLEIDNPSETRDSNPSETNLNPNPSETNSNPNPNLSETRDSNSSRINSNSSETRYSNLSESIESVPSLSTGNTSSDSTVSDSTDSNSTDQRNLEENTNWNEILVQGINNRLASNDNSCMYGTPQDTTLNTNPRYYTNEDLKPYPYGHLNSSGFRLPNLRSVDYHHCESPFIKKFTINDVNYSYTFIIGRNYILIPSYFYLDSNGESTFIELGRQYHIYPINETRNLYNCMITYPNNTTELINNDNALRHNILSHRCRVLMSTNPRDFLYTNPYEEFMEERILNFISNNTSNFTSDLAPFINKVLYPYEME